VAISAARLSTSVEHAWLLHIPCAAALGLAERRSAWGEAGRVRERVETAACLDCESLGTQVDRQVCGLLASTHPLRVLSYLYAEGDVILKSRRVTCHQ
jgi:hypothetical protein